MRTRRAVVASVLGATLAIPVAARANPDPVNGPIADGCQRNPAGLLSYTSPEWVFVGGKHSGQPMRELRGSATLVHTADEDLPESHVSYDMDFDVIPNKRYVGLLAGDPNANGGLGNGNFAHDADRGKLHVEWESGSVPTFAWPTERDRIHMWGQWVWDCGHWGQGIQTSFTNPQSSLIGTGDYLLPGQIEGPPPRGLRGEQTELHPIQAIAVTRHSSYRTPAPERETDFFASNDGTHAYAESVCSKRLSPLPAIASYGPDFSSCVNTAANDVTPLGGRSFEFLAPAPPRPSRRAKLTYREIRMISGHGFTERLRPTRAGLDVRVTDMHRSGDRTPVAFGSSFFIGWSLRRVRRPSHLRWTLKRITVLHSLSEPNPNHPTAAGYPGIGVYNLYASLNGYWNFLGGKGISGLRDSSWVPGLGFVHSGQTFEVNRSIDFFVPRGAPVRLEISGRECDLPRIAPCTVNAEVADGNDHPGTALVNFPSAPAAIGDHTLASPVPSPSDPNYRLTYSITRVTSGAPQAAAPGATGIDASSAGGDLGGAGRVLNVGSNGYPPLCISGVTPQSHLSRASGGRHGFAVAGRSREASCTLVRARGAIKAVRIALARLSGRRCAFLGPRGIGRLERCRLAHMFRAHGTSRWRLSGRTALRSGVYELWISALDRVGNVESPHTATFNVR